MQSVISHQYKTDVYINTKEPTGFIDPSNIDVSYDSVNRTITLQHSSGIIEYYWRGLKKGLVSPFTSIAHTNSDSVYFLKSVNGIDFIWENTPWSFSDIQVSYILYNPNYKIGIREVHGLMDYKVHEDLHNNIGTYLFSGGDLSGLIAGSTTANDRRPLVSSAVVKDEDLSTIINTLSSKINSYTIAKIEGTSVSNYISFATESSDIIPLLIDRPYYNQISGGNWVQTLVSNNAYMNIWLVAIPVTSDALSQKYRYVWIQGQTQNIAISTIQNESPRNLNLSNFKSISAEFVFVARIMIQYSGSNWRIIETSKLTGSQFSQISNSNGSFLSSVITNDTLSGNGTVSSPLSIGSAVTNQSSATLTLDSAHYNILCDCTANNITINLPLPASISISRRYFVKKMDISANIVTIDSVTNLIDGAATYVIQVQYGSVTIMNTGSQWVIVSAI